MAENNVNNSQQQNQQTQEKIKITMSENIRFDANIESCFMNTIELAEMIDEIFSQAFRDYAGCKISINDGTVPLMTNEVPYGALYASLYFKPNAGSGPLANIEPRVSGKASTKLASLRQMSGMNSGRMYEVNPKTYEALEDFCFFRNRRINWANLTSEMAVNFGYSTSYNQEIVVRISGLSLEQILNFAYGTEEDGKHFQYAAAPVQIVANRSNEYLVQITKLDLSRLNDLRKSLGGPVQNTEFHQYVK